jgi:hypothetical protein
MLEIGEPMDIPSGTWYTEDGQNNGNSCERDAFLC